MIRWRLIALSLAVLAGVSLTACESSQDKARKIQDQAKAAAPKPLVIKHPDKDVRVGSTTLLHDQNGDAIVVQLTNQSNKALVSVPILVQIRSGKRTVYKNDTAGLDYALNHVALIEPHQTLYWVNDQVTAQGKSAKVTVGPPEQPSPSGRLPQFTVTPPRHGQDISGPKVTGRVTLHSSVDQDHLILFAVARQGGRIVAAGRGQIKALKHNARPAPYVIYFIGNPVGAQVTIQTPPTTLK